MLVWPMCQACLCLLQCIAHKRVANSIWLHSQGKLQRQTSAQHALPPTVTSVHASACLHAYMYACKQVIRCCASILLGVCISVAQGAHHCGHHRVKLNCLLQMAVYMLQGSFIHWSLSLQIQWWTPRSPQQLTIPGFLPVLLRIFIWGSWQSSFWLPTYLDIRQL